MFSILVYWGHSNHNLHVIWIKLNKKQASSSLGKWHMLARSCCVMLRARTVVVARWAHYMASYVVLKVQRRWGVFKLLFSGAHSTQHFEQGAYFWCLSRWFLCVYKWTHISPPIFFLYYFQRVMPSNEVIVNMNNIATFSYDKFTPITLSESELSRRFLL